MPAGELRRIAVDGRTPSAAVGRTRPGAVRDRLAYKCRVPRRTGLSMLRSIYASWTASRSFTTGTTMSVKGFLSTSSHRLRICMIRSATTAVQLSANALILRRAPAYASPFGRRFMWTILEPSSGVSDPSNQKVRKTRGQRRCESVSLTAEEGH